MTAYRLTELPSPTDPLRPAGSPTTIFRKYMQGIAAGNVKVPCGTCNKCCRVPNLHVYLSEEERERFPRNHWNEKMKDYVLDRNDDGSCVYLIDSKCSVYEDRPGPCRKYDCRIEALAGVNPSGDPIILEAYAQWEFSYKTKHDKDLVTALRYSIMTGISFADAMKEASRTRAAFEGMSAEEQKDFCKLLDIRREHVIKAGIAGR